MSWIEEGQAWLEENKDKLFRREPGDLSGVMEITPAGWEAVDKLVEELEETSE